VSSTSSTMSPKNVWAQFLTPLDLGTTGGAGADGDRRPTQCAGLDRLAPTKLDAFF
jgi:hypothetical protein